MLLDGIEVTYSKSDSEFLISSRFVLLHEMWTQAIFITFLPRHQNRTYIFVIANNTPRKTVLTVKPLRRKTTNFATEFSIVPTLALKYLHITDNRVAV